MSKDYKKIFKYMNDRLKEQTSKEKFCLEKYKKENLDNTIYIVIYKDYIEMYSIDKFNGIGDVRTIKEIEKFNRNILNKYEKIK